MKRSSKVIAAITSAAIIAAPVTLAASATASPASESGFEQPFLGTPRYVTTTPSQVKKKSQLNIALGQARADEIAKRIGLDKTEVFTKKQYKLFVSGKGVGGDPASAKLVDQSVRILTNTVGRPLVSTVNGEKVKTVLASYGLIVNRDGLLESPANSTAPTRQVNVVIEPGGYMNDWAKANGATKAIKNLYASAFTREAVYGNKAQQQSGVAQLVPNMKNGVGTTVGMSIAPSIYVVNFALIYVLNPKLAAKMPAYWQPIPKNVADAIAASPTGQVPWSEYGKYLPQG